MEDPLVYKLDSSTNSTNTSIIDSDWSSTALLNRTGETLRELMEIQDNSYYCIIAHCLVFLIATTGNLTVLFSVLKQYKRSKSRISLLILHLSIADLIVCCTVIPIEVFWRITIQWMGGNVMCKLCQFLRAFGLYLSSMVLICMSLDRFFAILFPLEMLKGKGHHRVKVMLWTAWIASATFSIPQIVLFSIASHPEFPSFKQCVTNNLLQSTRDVRIYSIFSVSAMYFIPLMVILFTYTSILVKLMRKTHRQEPNLLQAQIHNPNGKCVESCDFPESLKPPSLSLKTLKFKRGGCQKQTKPMSCTSMMPQSIEVPSDCETHNGSQNETTSLSKSVYQHNPHRGERSEPCRLSIASQTSAYAARPHVVLRRSENAISAISRAKNRTLVTTLVIVCVFVLCWTPYVVMTLWYMFDWKGAQEVDPRVQDALFIMAIANSCVNPLIYGSFLKNCWGMFGSRQ